jgi:hypothetical protein
MWLEDLVCDALGDKDAWLSGCNLKGIKITIEIEEAKRQ